MIACLPAKYFEAFGNQKTWIGKATAECRHRLAPLFQFGVGEMAFLDAVLDKGVIDASRLDATDEVRAAIEACPALRWKAQNVAAWKSEAKRPRKPRKR